MHRYRTLIACALCALLAACGGGNSCESGRPGFDAQAQAEWDAECALPPAPAASAP